MSQRYRSQSVVRFLGVLSVAALAAAFATACDAGESSDQGGHGGSTTTTGSGGASAASGGHTATTGGTGNGSSGATASPGFGNPTYTGTGDTSDRYAKADTSRNGVSYFFMANGWGPGFESQTISFNGTSFTIEQMEGMKGPNYEPATYPTVFCGTYSDSMSGACGLPAAISSLTSLRTGWRWNANGNTGQYNAAYDIWLSTSSDISGHSAFLMVWLRDPPGQQPAGGVKVQNVTVANVPGSWNIWQGNVGGKPCISYVRAEGSDSAELEFDVLDFIRDAPTRSITIPGAYVLSVAVGFEIWSGPITNLESQDFYVAVQ